MTNLQARNAQISSALTSWLAAKLGAESGVAIEAVETARAAGFSAETVFVDARWKEGGKSVPQRLVLRRQILGHDLLHQPDLSFQAQVMRTLAKQPSLDGLVPGLIGVEGDSQLLGAPFLLMRRLPGQIIPQNPNYNQAGWLAELPLSERRRVWENGLRAMAAVHRLDWQENFAFLGRGKTPDLAGYIAWVEDWVRWAVNGRDYPVGEAALAYLKEEMPSGMRTGVVWGDPLVSNILFNEAGDVSGLLDWELATAGPGEIDLAWWLVFDELFSTDWGVRRLPGLPNRQETIALYEAAAGRPARNLEYFDVLARLRMAIVSMRAVDRQVALGKYKAANDAWSNNPFTAGIARKLGLEPVIVGPDFSDFNKMVMAKE